MNRNTNSHFAAVPKIDIPRSRFEMDFNHKTTFSAASCIPLYCSEILPGDTVEMDMSAAVRMSTPIFPVMDNLWLDTYWFFVPNRLVWEHWEEFLGENKTTFWEQETEYSVPQITAPAGGWAKGTIADYLGIPTLVDNISVNALPFRGLALIWNEWMRDQNLKQPAEVNIGDATLAGENFPEEETDSSYVTNAQLGGAPLKAAKIHGYFTSALPEPQKGPDVLIPLGGLSGTLPVVTVPGMNNTYNGEPMRMAWNRTWTPTGNQGLLMASASPYGLSKDLSGAVFSAEATDVGNSDRYMSPSNLGVVTGSSNETNSTINQLRMAFAMQKFYEKLGRSGSRYREILKSLFGVENADSRMQIPEYLGGNRHPINIDQVLQTSETTETSPQGNTAAYSLTNFVENSFVKSFTEHGYLYCIAVVRHDLTYQQGLHKKWSRLDKFDFYWPGLSAIGEQIIANKEIYAQGTAEDDEAFGYQEAWAEYRYLPNRVSGAFRSNYQTTLDAWHYADYYDELPTLSSQWIDADYKNIDRTLAVQSSVEDQFIGDFFFKSTYTRPMPLYSVPGLIDHY